MKGEILGYSLWGVVWAEQLHGPVPALPWGLCSQSDLQNEKCITVCFGTVYLMMLSLIVCIFYEGLCLFCTSLPFFEILFLDEVWEVNAFKYISQPLFFFVIILFIHLHRTHRLEAK